MSHHKLWQKINECYLMDETQLMSQLLDEGLSDTASATQLATGWVESLRQQANQSEFNEDFMREYDLSSDEGIILMSLAEALLRIPDAESAQQLIHDYLLKGDWLEHLGRSDSLWVNAASWGLQLSQQVVGLADDDMPQLWKRLVSRLGTPLLQQAITTAMSLLGYQFVMGKDIASALNRADKQRSPLHYFSYDMLGEAAVSAEDASHYYDAYYNAISELADNSDNGLPLYQRQSISIKLSALHPRYEYTQRDRLISELTPRLLALACHAKQAGVCITLDAEECERLDILLEIFGQLYSDSHLADWSGLGLAVQAYQKRANAVVEWLISLTQQQKKTIPLRLVKGAYWDNEIKRAQQQGLSSYPVFTRKQNTDVSYLVCAQKMLSSPYIYSQFATHNAHTIAALLGMAKAQQVFEFQRLHGMGESLYNIIHNQGHEVPVRVYAPVGDYRELLPYLVRRLLENGANSSFINRIWDQQISPEAVAADPVAFVAQLTEYSHPGIPLPVHLYGDQRKNAQGFNLSDLSELAQLQQGIQQALRSDYRVFSQGKGIANGSSEEGERYVIYNPANPTQALGSVRLASAEQLDMALQNTLISAPNWSFSDPIKRAEILQRCADLLEQQHLSLLALLITEAGKVLADAVAELREAVDFCRYYAAQLLNELSQPIVFPGPVGEENQLHWAARGVFVSISPWNFPMAIFTGQIAAALAAGNCVLAKAAHQTPILAQQIITLFYQAGIPDDVLYFLPTSGTLVSQRWLSDSRISGVVFTGSTDTAQKINQTLALRDGPITPLIAETGGQNTMIVDSSALPEQVVKDVVRSAFNSAGQRCSALRILYLQDEIADRVIELLKGAMAELLVGDPAEIATDVGPVIDEEAYDKLVLHAAQLETKGELLYQTPLQDNMPGGYFVAPSLFMIEGINALPHEIFGPMLHVVRYSANQLDSIIDEINQCGYGLTLGIHSRIEQRIEFIRQRARVGNLYINRDMVGAVVGVQPFGGEGLSGTGFKAGGPHYIYRFCTERSVSINSAALGGNAQLLNLEDHD